MPLTSLDHLTTSRRLLSASGPAMRDSPFKQVRRLKQRNCLRKENYILQRGQQGVYIGTCDLDPTLRQRRHQNTRQGDVDCLLVRIPSFKLLAYDDAARPTHASRPHLYGAHSHPRPGADRGKERVLVGDVATLAAAAVGGIQSCNCDADREKERTYSVGGVRWTYALRSIDIMKKHHDGWCQPPCASLPQEGKGSVAGPAAGRVSLHREWTYVGCETSVQQHTSTRMSQGDVRGAGYKVKRGKGWVNTGQQWNLWFQVKIANCNATAEVAHSPRGHPAGRRPLARSLPRGGLHEPIRDLPSLVSLPALVLPKLFPRFSLAVVAFVLDLHGHGFESYRKRDGGARIAEDTALAVEERPVVMPPPPPPKRNGGPSDARRGGRPTQGGVHAQDGAKLVGNHAGKGGHESFCLILSLLSQRFRLLSGRLSGTVHTRKNYLAKERTDTITNLLEWIVWTLYLITKHDPCSEI
ncbi:hypothetical protein B0H19DRAFT_1063440 [Mycena capillaripes]|nr:hypothetical protein B0H19DRAFT_1063440 [Mycena capillaripes]